MVEYHFTFEFEKSTGDTITETAVATTRQEAYSVARQRAINSGVVRDIQEFESELSLKLTRYGYKNPPWGTGDELIDVFRSMDVVSTARYSDPMEGAYGPPTWYIRSASDATQDDVVDAVESYFEGFEITVENDVVAVSTTGPDDIE